jgi:hypothetical protein
MKNIHNKLRTLLFLGAFMVLGTTQISAQIIFPDDVDDETPAAPIDGLIGVGLIAGACIGLRKKMSKQD